MFNQQPFNRGKFNANSSQAMGASGVGLMKMKSNVIEVIKVISANGISNIAMKSKADGTKVIYNIGYQINMMLNDFAEGTKVYVVTSDDSNMKLETQARQSVGGEDVIMLNNINLKPGDELIIDTCNLTVSVNGNNGMKFFDNESDFFALLNGINTLVYEDNVTDRDISLNVIWKDRWL